MRPLAGSGGPFRPGWLGGIALLAGAAIAWGAFELGQLRAGHNRFTAMKRESQLLSDLAETRKAKQELEQRVTLLETDAKIKAEAYKEVEGQLGELQAVIQKQAEDIAFYRGIVGDQSVGLRVQDFGLVAGAEPGAYSVRVVLAQALRDGRRVSGTVELVVNGEEDGHSAAKDLSDLAADGPRELPFSFRYFQNLETDLSLPGGFQPETVTVRVRPRGKGVKPVEASFDWAPGQG